MSSDDSSSIESFGFAAIIILTLFAITISIIVKQNRARTLAGAALPGELFAGENLSLMLTNLIS